MAAIVQIAHAGLSLILSGRAAADERGLPPAADAQVLERRFPPMYGSPTNSGVIQRTNLLQVRRRRLAFGSVRLGLFLRGEREQDVAREAAEARVAGIDEHHSFDYDRTRTVDRSALGLHSVHRREIPNRVVFPQHLSVLSGVGTEKSAKRSRKDDSGQGRERSGLRRAAPRPRSAIGRRREPNLRAVGN